MISGLLLQKCWIYKQLLITAHKYKDIVYDHDHDHFSQGTEDKRLKIWNLGTPLPKTLQILKLLHFSVMSLNWSLFLLP